MNVSGVLVFAKPDRLESVSQALCLIPGVEVHATTAAGRMVVTIEKNNTHETVDCVTQLQYVDDVLSVSMIYNHFDSANDESVINDHDLPVCGCAAE